MPNRLGQHVEDGVHAGRVGLLEAPRLLFVDVAIAVADAEQFSSWAF